MKLSDLAYEKIKQAIIENKIKINQRVLLEEAAEICGCSRSPVSTAIIRLEQEGWVKVTPRHGFQVSPASRKGLKELYELIGLLEINAIELCIKNGVSKDDIELLKNDVINMSIAVKENNITEWLKHDNLFHDRIASLSGNALLKNHLSQLREQDSRYFYIFKRSQKMLKESVNEHNQLVKILSNHDFHDAKTLHLEHWQQVSDRLITYLDEFGMLND